MWSKSINIEVIVICFLSLIPWPGPSVFKITCSRESSRVVRKIVQSKWIPILEKYQVKLPMECPFHPLRDIFGPQQSAKKQHRSSQWTCGFCGKSFFEEKYLDLHFETRHKTKINMAEDAVCLSDYCDIMRCQVLVAQDSTLSFGDSSIISTDIEIWSESTAYRTALSPSGPRDLAKLPLRGAFTPPYSRETKGQPITETIVTDDIEVGSQASDASCQPNENHCDKTEQGSGHDQGDATEISTEKSDDNNDGDDENDNNITTSCEKDLVDSSLPPVDRKQQRISELQKLKANCRTEDLDKLKIRCEILVRDCIAGLLMHLSEQDFREMEDELNRAVCWYLTCDRYWEDGPPEPRSFPWGLVFVLVMVLSLGVCFCYYIIWVLFDSGTDDQSIQSTSTQVTAHSSPTHTRQQSNSSVTNYYNLHHHHQSPHTSAAINSNMQSNMINQSLSPSSSSAAIIQTSSINNQLGGSGSNNSASGSGSMINIGSQQQQQQQHQQQTINNQHHSSQSTSQPNILGFPDEYYAAPSDYGDLGPSEHYIYVTYPPELKRRLLESCYNRTTRL